MRIIHVVSAIAEEASGPSYSVTRLCESLILLGMDLRLATLDWAPMANEPAYLKRFPLSWGPRRLGASSSMRRWLENAAASGEINLIHNHGLWMMPNVYPGRACTRRNPYLIVSPRGTLSRWALGLNRFPKFVFWRLLQRPSIRLAACFHATAASEYQDIRRLGFRQPISIIPNGVDIPRLLERRRGGRLQLLFLGRIHPIKGVDILLRAWKAIEHQFMEWELHIAGPGDDGYTNEMRALAAQLRIERIVFRGPLYGDEKWKAYQDANLFVLPTHSENFGMTVAESLASGTPAIVTQGAPWSRLNEQGAGWWVECGVEALASCLGQALSVSPQRLAEMGQAGREWMQRELSWDRVAAQHLETYRWLRNGGERPQCVRMD